MRSRFAAMEHRFEAIEIAKTELNPLARGDAISAGSWAIYRVTG